jgi:hypothetical protein
MYLPSNGRNYENTSLFLRLLPHGYLIPLLVYYLLLIVRLLVTSREIHLVAHIENLPLCQA